MLMKYGDEPMRFRKKPVVIEAMQFNDGNKNQVFNWVTCNTYPDWDASGNPVLKIQTLEGDMIAQLGDWIIKGVKGEFYPCKADIFAATYEPADDTPPIDCDALGRPSFEERRAANDKALDDIRRFVYGS